MKERLDVILVNQGYAPSREKAKAVIMSGVVYVNGQKEDKAGSVFDTAKCSVEVRGSRLRYVSRGGLKLEKAFSLWGFDLQGCVCMDIGSSTGGFTDCMLQNGAARVYAVDVGQGQLDWRLRNDERVVVMEKTNFRYMKREDIEDDLDFASVDVSFISLTKILIPARELLKPGARMVCLVKPQFEAGRGKVGKNGVVREPQVHRDVLHKTIDYASEIGFELLGLDFSPIRGPEGNLEYLLHIRKRDVLTGRLCGLSEKEAEAGLERILEERSGISQTEEWKARIMRTVEESHSIGRSEGQG